MKKALKIIGFSLLSLNALLLIAPFLFKGKIIEFVKKEANSQLNATLNFDNVGLSFIKNFPKATISLNDLSIVGKDEFEGDTLVFAKTVSVTVNLASIFGSSGYEISKILLDKPLVNAIVLQDGKANWDIMKASEEISEPEDTTSSSMKLLLRNLTINKANIYYRDEEAKMSASINELQLTLSGDMTADHTALKSDASIKALSFAMSGVPYLTKAEINMHLNIDADMKNGKYTLDHNVLRLNAIETGIDGWVAMLDEGYEMDLTLNSSKVDFKQLLSLVPAIYAKDFAGVKASGNVQLAATAKGKMVDESLPMFDVKLLVDNG
ncbi:MAG: AsmA family protein, partial [Bacteroidales bacterium]|nr:AsmA family protein [Bacteroidales bacterium]